MTPDDVTRPYTQRPAPKVPWPSFDAPTRASSPIPQGRRGGHSVLWMLLGFFLGAVVTAIVALRVLAPTPAPNVAAQSNGALTVTMTDSLLDRSLTNNLPSAGGALGQARAHIQANGEIVISGNVQAPSGDASQATIVVQPVVSQSILSVTILRASVGGTALPPSVFDSVRDQINQQLRQSSRVSFGVGQALVITGVSFSDGSMTLSYAPASA